MRKKSLNQPPEASNAFTSSLDRKRLLIRISDFGFLASFGLRTSIFGLAQEGCQ